MRRPSRLTVALFLLTAVTGVVEAVSFIGLGRVFTAVMTGNALFVGFGLIKEEEPVVAPLVALAALSAGALTGHRINNALIRRAGDRWLAYALYGEGALLVLAALLALGLPSEAAHLSPHRFTVIVAVSAIMGARNVTILQAGTKSKDMPTTVITRSLAGVFMHVPPETRARRLATVVAMVLGAGVGVLLLRLHPTVPLLLAAAAVAGAGALCGRDLGRSRPPAAPG